MLFSPTVSLWLIFSPTFCGNLLWTEIGGHSFLANVSLRIKTQPYLWEEPTVMLRTPVKAFTTWALHPVINASGIQICLVPTDFRKNRECLNPDLFLHYVKFISEMLFCFILSFLRHYFLVYLLQFPHICWVLLWSSKFLMTDGEVLRLLKLLSLVDHYIFVPLKILNI